MLLIQMCLRCPTWFQPERPAFDGTESFAARATPAQSAVTPMANQHHIGLAPIHAPPRLLPLS